MDVGLKPLTATLIAWRSTSSEGSSKFNFEVSAKSLTCNQSQEIRDEERASLLCSGLSPLPRARTSFPSKVLFPDRVRGTLGSDS